jgi:hypothetical protein
VLNINDLIFAKTLNTLLLLLAGCQRGVNSFWSEQKKRD